MIKLDMGISSGSKDLEKSNQIASLDSPALSSSGQSLSISYVINQDVRPAEVASLIANSGIDYPRDPDQISKMITNANLIITARYNRKLVGILRGFTDYVNSCYIPELVVDRKYPYGEIHNELLRMTRVAVGSKVRILLLSSLGLDSLYPSLGFNKMDNAWSSFG